MTIKNIIEMCEEMAGLGVHHLVFNMPNDHEIVPIKTIGNEVIPQIKNI